jgi:hypothetical protein
VWEIGELVWGRKGDEGRGRANKKTCRTENERIRGDIRWKT